MSNDGFTPWYEVLGYLSAAGLAAAGMVGLTQLLAKHTRAFRAYCRRCWMLWRLRAELAHIAAWAGAAETVRGLTEEEREATEEVADVHYWLTWMDEETLRADVRALAAKLPRPQTAVGEKDLES